MTHSRAATQAIIEKDVVYLITIVKGGNAMPLAASKNVKDAHEFARLVGGMAEPSKSYKGTIRALKKDLLCRLWDKARYGDCFPAQDHVEIRPIKLI